MRVLTWIFWMVLMIGQIEVMNCGEPVDAGEPFGKLKLVHEIDCTKTDPSVMFIELPKGASKVETILGRPCRVLPNTLDKASYFGYVIGEGKGLKAGRPYLLSVEYPEDVPRSFHIGNWGCETMKGLATGTAVGDILKGRYVNHNPESLQYPLAGEYRQWRQLFFLHDRFFEIKKARGPGNRPMTPDDGFMVIIAQPESKLAPMSAGAAVSRIRLFEVENLEALSVKRTLPEGLPERRLFWREEMSDNVVQIGHKPEEKLPELRGVVNREDWYEFKCRLMLFLGMNTFAKDLLEFGHNQGWDSTPEDGGGASDWYNQSPDPQHWSRILDAIGKYGLGVMPMYEYAGSIGQNNEKSIGSQRRCMTLQGGKNYTHIEWCHKTNADLADADFLEDAKKVLKHTIVRYKDKVKFVGAWFRPRPEANPISFNNNNLARFAAEANEGRRIMRSHLQTDKDLLQKYYAWWFDKRKEFLYGLADYLRENVNPEALVIYTADSSEPGVTLPADLFVPEGEKEPWRWKAIIATDRKDVWDALLNSQRFASDKRFEFMRAASMDDILDKKAYLKALLSPKGTWGEYEWQHSCPWPDPANYKDSEKVALTYSFNRQYTVNDPEALDTFRTRNNLVLIRHYALNENEMTNDKDEILGYFVSDVEHAGPYSMAAEALAVANGDPTMIGYLAGNNFNRGFPEFARNFNAAFISLPALPSTRLENVSSDKDVVVREIRTPSHGTYYAVVNTAMTPREKVVLTLPAAGVASDAASGEQIKADSGKIQLSLYPYQLKAILVK